MGIVHVHRGRLAPTILLTALVVLAVAAVMALAAGPAQAQKSFASCASSTACHDQTGSADAFHTKPGHAAAAGCATCHVGGFGAANKGVTPKACVTCHTPASAVLAKPTHADNACGTTPGCHGVPPAVATTTLALKVAPTIVRVGKSVKVTGTAGPAASLAGAKVALKVERKVGTKWVKMKTASRTASATGAFTWTYKTAKKGAHRVSATIAKTSTHTAKKVVKAFKVK